MVLSEMMRKIYVEVNEEGAEAAAGGGTREIAGGAVNDELTPIVLNFKRLFLFAICDNLKKSTLF